MAKLRLKTQMDLLRSAQQLELPFPETLRAFFEILALHDPRRGLDEFLDRFAWHSVTFTQLQKLFPEIARDGQAATDQPEDLRASFAAMLASNAFRANAMLLFLAAFPEKRREVFIHIPRCAGTDLSLSLGPTRLTVPQFIESRDGLSTEELCGALADLARNVRYFDHVFVYGQMHLSNYIRRCGVRPGDRIFTILRDPIDLMLSQANHAIAQLRTDPDVRNPQTRVLRAHLGLPVEAGPLSAAQLREAGIRALFDARITQPNSDVPLPRVARPRLGGRGAPRHRSP